MRFEDLTVDPWGAWFMGRRLPCAIGRGGIGQKKGEGDGITPIGVRNLEELYMRHDRCAFPLAGDAIGVRDGWSDDPRDPAYNRKILRPHRFGHEALRRSDPLYDLIGVLDFNRNPAVPGAGSAIFLHVWRKPRHPTEGCIAFAKRDLIWILEHWTVRSRVVVRSPVEQKIS